MQLKHTQTIVYLTVFLSLLLTIVSFSGGFIESTYKREALSLAVQGIGQDIFDLFIVVPLLLISMFFTTQGKRTALFIFAGTVFYIMYSFFIYSFGIHFNMLFVFYCFTLGSSFYLFVLLLTEMTHMDIERWFEEKTPVRSTASFFLLIAVLFYFLWFSDIIPAIVNNTIPKSVSDYNLLVDPVHVLDLSFVLPGLIITSILLIKKRKTGFIFAAVLLIFTVLLSLALIAMAVMLNVRNVTEDFSLVIIFSVIAVISVVYLFIFLKRMKTPDAL